MLDDEEGVAELLVHALDIGRQILQQRAVDAGRHLVEQHDLGIDHHGAAELEQLLLAAAQIARELVLDMRELQEIDDVVGLLPHRDLALPRPCPA